MAGAADAVNSALASIDVEDPFAAVDVPPVDISGAMSSVPCEHYEATLHAVRALKAKGLYVVALETVEDAEQLGVAPAQLARLQFRQGLSVHPAL